LKVSALKRVCFFNSTSFWGGGEKLHLEYAMYFDQKGFAVFVACRPGSPLHEKAMAAQLKTIPVKTGDLSFLNPFAVQKVAQSLKKRGIDTLIATTSEDIKMCGFAAQKAAIDRVVYLRGLAVPIKRSLINSLLFRRYITHIVANSEETKRQIFKNIEKGKIKGRVAVIYHGIDTGALLKETTKIKLPGLTNGAIVLGNAGRLTEQKGQLLLIEVAKILRDRKLNFRLYIAGEGEMRATLEKRIAACGLENYVYLLGFVSEMNSFMNALDVFLLSSAWEGFGFVLVEAMLKECPVVAFNTSSNPEIVLDRQTGYLVNYPDVQAFADKVEWLIKNKDLRSAIGEKAKQHVLNHFNKEERIDEFIDFISPKNSCLLTIKIENGQLKHF
jgi:glycosyltransferase involved in cell wall biosynthesis